MATTAPKPRLAALYARVSREERALGQIASNDTQVASLRDLARTLKLPVAPDTSGLIVAEEHSGTDLRWQGSHLMGLVRRAQAGDFTDLLVLNVDRFCRGGADAFREQLGYFEQAGVTVHFAQLPLPEDMPFRASVQGFVADAAQYWRNGIIEASVRVRTASAARGDLIPGNIPPFGWQFVEDETRLTRRGRPVKVGLAPNPATAPWLLHAYEHVAAGGSIGALKRELMAAGVPTPKGAPVWHPETIRRFLHNPTNWGERKSFYLRTKPHAEGVHRPASVKSRTTRERVPVDEQYAVSPTVITPIPGLTKDLAMRALARLTENQSRRQEALSVLGEAERAARGLLFGGMCRCGTCGGGMRLKRHAQTSRWDYYCAHSGTPHEGEPSVAMATSKLDATVWALAIFAVRDPSFFERLVLKADEVTGPAALARAQETLLAEAERERDNLQKHLRRLDPDAPEDAEMLASVDGDLRRVLARITSLTRSLAASRDALAAEEARRAALTAFRDYAAAERAHLDAKTPLERHQMLRALFTRVRLRGAGARDRVRIVFDLRHLPGAAQWLRPGLGESPAPMVDFDGGVYSTLEVLQRDGAVPFAALLPANAPIDPAEWQGRYESEAAYLADIEAQMDEKVRAFTRYQGWLTRTGQPDSDAAWLAWNTRPEPNQQGDGVPVARSRS